MAPKHWEHPVLANDIDHIGEAIIDGTATINYLRLRSPPREITRPWRTFSDEMRCQWEILYSFQNHTPMNNSWDNTEYYVHGKDTQMVLYLQDFPVDRWLLPIEEAKAAVRDFLGRERIRRQGRSIFESHRRRSAGVTSLAARASGPAPSGGALRSSSGTTASVSTTPGVNTGAPVVSRPSRAQVSSLSAVAPVVTSRVPSAPGIRSSRRLADAAAAAAAAGTTAPPGAIAASQSADASTSTLPAPPVASQSSASVTSAPLAPDRGLYTTNPVPEILQSRANSNKQAVDPANFPWLQARSSRNSSQWTDDIYTKSQLRDVEAVHRGNEPHVRELETYEKIGDMETHNLQRHEPSIRDANRTQKFLNDSNTLSREAALRIIDFCPHLLYGNVLLRVMAEGSLSQSEIRHRLLLNGVVISLSNISRRMRTALGHVLARETGTRTPKRKVADAWVDINTANFEKYKKSFLEGTGASTAVVDKTPKGTTSGAGKAESRKRVRKEESTAPDPKRAKTRSQTMREATG